MFRPRDIHNLVGANCTESHGDTRETQEGGDDGLQNRVDVPEELQRCDGPCAHDADGVGVVDMPVCGVMNAKVTRKSLGCGGGVSTTAILNSLLADNSGENPKKEVDMQYGPGRVQDRGRGALFAPDELVGDAVVDKCGIGDTEGSLTHGFGARQHEVLSAGRHHQLDIFFSSVDVFFQIDFHLKFVVVLSAFEVVLVCAKVGVHVALNASEISPTNRAREGSLRGQCGLCGAVFDNYNFSSSVSKFGYEYRYRF